MRCVHAEVAAVRRLSPGFARVTLTAPDLDLVGSGGPFLDCRIKLIFGAAEGFRLDSGPVEGVRWFTEWRALPAESRGAMRTFSVVAARPGEIDVDFALHEPYSERFTQCGIGPAATWVHTARPGDRLEIIGPNRSHWEASGMLAAGTEFRPGQARRIALIGDATALPAIESILRDWRLAAAPGAEALVIAEVGSADDRRPLERPGVTVHWVVTEQAPGRALAEAVPGLLQHWTGLAPTEASPSPADDALPEPGPGEILWETASAPTADERYVWVAGEQNAVKQIRRHCVGELGLDRRSVAFMGYWKLGQAQAA
jgi:NADPH-dependent ferric siderophore reductase